MNHLILLTLHFFFFFQKVKDIFFRSFQHEADMCCNEHFTLYSVLCFQILVYVFVAEVFNHCVNHNACS